MKFFKTAGFILSIVFILTFFTIAEIRCFQSEFGSQRKKMVNEQIIARGIKDKKVINALLEVPRHEFIPEIYRKMAYNDHPVPIGYEQTISQPYIVAFMTEALMLKSDDRVLEVGTGSGYQAAVLSKIAREVYSIEIIEQLGLRAAATLERLKFNNVHVIIGDGYNGFSEKMPYDAIIITAAPGKIPEPLIEQLKDGGRMIIPVGNLYQDLILIEKKDGRISRKKLIPVRFVPMTGKVRE